MPLILRVEVPTSSCGGIALCLGIPPWQDRFSYVCDYKGTVRERLGFCRRDRHVVKSVCRVRSPPPAPREQLFWVFKYAVAFFFYIVTSSLFWKFPRTLKIRVYSLCVCVCTSRRWRGGRSRSAVSDCCAPLQRCREVLGYVYVCNFRLVATLALQFSQLHPAAACGGVVHAYYVCFIYFFSVPT